MPPAKKPNRLFDCLNAINHKNPTYKYDKKDCSAYMLLMWFSHATDCSEIINKINTHLFDIPDELVYHYLYKSVPKGQRFIKYDKGTPGYAIPEYQPPSGLVGCVLSAISSSMSTRIPELDGNRIYGFSALNIWHIVLYLAQTLDIPDEEIERDFDIIRWGAF